MKRRPEKADDLLTKLFKWPMAPDPKDLVDVETWLENLSELDRQKLIDRLMSEPSKDRRT